MNITIEHFINDFTELNILIIFPVAHFTSTFNFSIFHHYENTAYLKFHRYNVTSWPPDSHPFLTSILSLRDNKTVPNWVHTASTQMEKELSIRC